MSTEQNPAAAAPKVEKEPAPAAGAAGAKKKNKNKKKKDAQKPGATGDSSHPATETAAPATVDDSQNAQKKEEASGALIKKIADMRFDTDNQVHLHAFCHCLLLRINPLNFRWGFPNVNKRS